MYVELFDLAVIVLYDYDLFREGIDNIIGDYGDDTLYGSFDLLNSICGVGDDLKVEIFEVLIAVAFDKTYV